MYNFLASKSFDIPTQKKGIALTPRPYMYICWHNGQGPRNGPEYWGTISGRMIPKIQKRYLMHPYLTLKILSGAIQGKNVAPSSTPRCSIFWKGSLCLALEYGLSTYLIRTLYDLKKIQKLQFSFKPKKKFFYYFLWNTMDSLQILLRCIHYQALRHRNYVIKIMDTWQFNND